jgi:hypothetical protein
VIESPIMSNVLFEWIFMVSCMEWQLCMIRSVGWRRAYIRFRVAELRQTVVQLLKR